MDNADKDNILISLMRRECLVFVGAGMSISAGLPSGNKLAEKLFRILSKNSMYQKPYDFTLPRIANDFESMHSRTKLEELIREEIIECMDKVDKTSYELLAKLEPLPNDIITTNYDRLLESALGEKNYTPIFKDDAVSKYTLNKTNLFKIHGDVSSLEDAVITEKDMKDFALKHPLVLNKIRSLFQERTIIFLGFSIEDDHIRAIYKETREKLKNHAPKAYAVTLDDTNHRFEEIGVKHIKQDVNEFLEEIISLIEKEGHNNLPFQILQTPNKNPFSIYSTEYFPENSQENLINNTFIPPVDFSTVVEPGNTIIEGHRGSGKSMMLKYLSYEEQIRRSFCEDWDTRYIGIYLKFRNTLVDTVTLELFKVNKAGRDPKKEWINYFLAYVNLLIGEEIIKCLNIAKDKKIISIDSEKNLVSEIIFLFFYSVPYNFEKENLKNLLLLISRVRNEFAQKHFSEWTLPGDFLEQLVSKIKDHVKEWSEKDIYILLDEYDNLNEDQQRVVNTLVKNRSFSYKIGVKLFDMIYEDAHGRLLENKNDFTYVSTDRFDLRPGEYREFVLNVANKRLSTYGYKNTIEDLLPLEEDENKKGFENGDYSGIENIVKLSSGIIRDFLELCKDMIYYSNMWILDGKISNSKDILDVVNPNIQNTVIKIHSNILYENVDHISGIDSDSAKARSENTRTLIDNLAEIFSNILNGSESKEDRTVSSFQLKEVEELNKTATNALNDSISYRLLQVPYSPRRPQETKKHAPHKRYRFHRLLCPRFKLSLAERWPKEISSEVFNEIFSEPKKTVSQITKYFIKDTPPIIDRKITDYE